MVQQIVIFIGHEASDVFFHEFVSSSRKWNGTQAIFGELQFCGRNLQLQSVFAGKEELVQKLQEQLKEAEVVVNEESANLQQLQLTVQAATKAAQQAQTELKLLQTTLQLAQGKCCKCEYLIDNIQRLIQMNSDIQFTLKSLDSEMRSSNRSVANATGNNLMQNLKFLCLRRFSYTDL